MDGLLRAGGAKCAVGFLYGNHWKKGKQLRPTERAIPNNFRRRLPRDAIAWATLILLLSIQAVQFYRFAQREVIWSYPANHDQLAYLDLSYRAYDAIRREGISRGIADASGIRPEQVPLAAQGTVLHVQAALLYLLTGPSRLAAISLNLFYWLAFQSVFCLTLRRVTRKWSWAFFGVGLLIATRSRFNFAGDLFDFRLDFAASCLFGIFICAAVRSGLTHRRWCAVAGLVGGSVVALRFITAAYFAGILGVTGVGLVVACVLSKTAKSRTANLKKLFGLGVMSLALLAVAGPTLWLHWPSVRSYYFVWHEGPDKFVRAAAMGNTDWRTALGYYPKSLVRDHLGRTFLIVAATCAGAGMVRRVRSESARATQIRCDRWIALFITSCVLVPLAVLTVDVDKSPVVGGIMVPAVVWLVVLFCRSSLDRAGDHTRTAALATLAAVVALAAGMTVQVTESRRHRPAFSHRTEAQTLLAAYGEMARLSRAKAWDSPRIAVDCNVDFLTPTILEVTEYEKNRHFINVGETLTRLQECPSEDIFSALAESDFVILSSRTSDKARKPRFPFDRQMEALHTQLTRWCDAHCRVLTRLDVFDREVVVYVRKE